MTFRRLDSQSVPKITALHCPPSYSDYLPWLPTFRRPLSYRRLGSTPLSPIRLSRRRYLFQRNVWCARTCQNPPCSKHWLWRKAVALVCFLESMTEIGMLSGLRSIVVLTQSRPRHTMEQRHRHRSKDYESASRSWRRELYW